MSKLDQSSKVTFTDAQMKTSLACSLQIKTENLQYQLNEHENLIKTLKLDNHELQKVIESLEKLCETNIQDIEKKDK